MKYSHNKKRNTAFVYETLIVEISKAVIKNKLERKNNILMLLREFFKKDTILNKDLEIYKSFYETKDINDGLIEKLLSEAKKQYTALNRKLVFDTQTKLINEVNKKLGPEVWNNFVPDYKKLATINQTLNQDIPPKKQVLMERKLINNFLKNKEEKKPFPNVNNLAVKTFIQKFNKEYSDSLTEQQKTFLNKYIMSSNDSGIEFKVYLYEEIDRLKTVLQETIAKSDKDLSTKLEKVISKMTNYNQRKIDKSLVSEIMKIQSLTNEVCS